MNNNFLSGKKVLVMGLGRFGGGVDAAKFAACCGADVVVTDLASQEELTDSLSQLNDCPNIEYHLGSHDETDFENADIVIANPAVPLNNKFLKIAAACGNIVTSQIAIFFTLCPAPIIGITGSNGKSTTTALSAHILRGAKNTQYQTVWLSGNIGNEPLLMLLDKIKPNDLAVLELSSFQIEQLAAESRFIGAPQVALLTNLLPNHLDRYETFENYCRAKELLFENQKPQENNPAISIFNRDDNIAMQWYDRYKNQPNRKCLLYSSDDVSATTRACFNLPGRCNLANLAAAMTIAEVFGVEQNDIEECLPDFHALPHRLQFIAEHNGVRWFNDSKATTPEATIAALEAFDEKIVIIAGGYDKQLPFDELAKIIAQKARAAMLIGTTAQKIKSAVEAAAGKNVSIEICDTLADAVSAANRIAQKGDVVLLSPACASYDMFDNYEQRAEQFIDLVKKL
ncbi:MAG: UDP-N-acetylmuramoyl-L-alanine--D-glutamate ligase [Phycisphaerae bacterium]|jgi:UDP-N-acetylmuramoylalanine--D-glutamate ligase